MSQIPANIQNPLNGENPEQNPPQPVPQPTKKPRETITLKAEHFEKENGLQALYKAIQSTDFTRGQDNVELTMKKITSILKTWHYQMLPKYSFDLFLQRCKALGNHKFTQAYMSKVRRIHKGDDTWGTSQPNEQDALNNVNLQHLNPNDLQMNEPQRQETLEEKFQQVYKLTEGIQKREERRMQIQRDEMQRMQEMLDEDDEDVEDMMRQMEEMQAKANIKKQSLRAGNQASTLIKKENRNPNLHSDFQQVPYVPQGFGEIDFEQESDYNN